MKTLLFIAFSLLSFSAFSMCSPGPSAVEEFSGNVLATMGTVNGVELSEDEEALFNGINLARTNPKEIARILEEQLEKYNPADKSYPIDGLVMRSREGDIALKEAIEFFKVMKPVPALKLTKGMSRAAKEHAIQQGEAGTYLHESPDGTKPVERMKKYGAVFETYGEGASFGPMSGLGHVLSLLVDDGIANRGHRTRMLMREFGAVGVGCAKHKINEKVCVIDYAGKYSDNSSGGAREVGDW